MARYGARTTRFRRRMASRTVAGGPSEASDHRKRGRRGNPTPAGVAYRARTDSTSPEISFVEIDAVLFEKLPVLLLKRALLMMFLLLLDVFADGENGGLADGERSVAFLPRETADVF